MSVSRVVPNITTRLVAETRDFFVDLLGFETVMEMDWITTVASPENHSAQINIIRAEKGRKGGVNPVLLPPQITVQVDDVDAVYTEAKRRGLDIPHDITNESWGVRRFFVTDPNGLVINVMNHV